MTEEFGKGDDDRDIKKTKISEGAGDDKGVWEERR